MNIEIANRLVQLRKKNNLSQEELADKLGISRQAVSKWERAEASPDTDNLICLAKLYNISLDELLSTEQSTDDIAKENKEKNESKKEKDYVSISPSGIHVKSADGDVVDISPKGIHVNDGESETIINDDVSTFSTSFKKNIKWSKIERILFTSLLTLSIAVYITLGLVFTSPYHYGNITLNNPGWVVGWTVFFAPFILTSLANAIYLKRMSRFNMVFLVTAIFVILGMLLGIWHPLWVIFFAIPIYYSLSHEVEKLIKISKNKTKIVDTQDVDETCDK